MSEITNNPRKSNVSTVWEDHGYDDANGFAVLIREGAMVEPGNSADAYNTFDGKPYTPGNSDTDTDADTEDNTTTTT